ncbi:MAG: hypothetical protein K0S74_768 [Chlamydiales bacterium]|nr:hypothetical protein [Chlamydiales bacterium]
MSATIAYNMQGGIKEAERIRKLQAAKLIESTLTYELQIDSSEVKQGIHLQDWGQAIEKSSLLDQEKKNYYKQLVSNQEIDLNYAEGVVKAQVK